MFQKVIVFSIALLFISLSLAKASWTDPALEKVLAGAMPDDDISIVLFLKYQLDIEKSLAALKEDNAGLARRHYEIITQLRDMSWSTQEDILRLAVNGREKGKVSKLQSFWITNALAITANPDIIEAIINHKDVKSVYLDPEIELIAPVEIKESSPVPKGVENGVLVSGAVDLWNMGIDGAGTLACDQDTGADGVHPAFGDRWRGHDAGVAPEHAWFDPNYGETFPTDFSSHGTHTLGTILGDDLAGNKIGMAPKAKWIGAKTIDVGGDIYSDAIAAFEWAADPDGDPLTMDDVPDVINNSWGLAGGYWGPCLSDFNAAIDGAEAAGVVVIFAAGNEGPFAESIRSPGNRIASDLNVFSVGALNQDNETIANFSSRGPSDCDHATIKPEICAVGVDVRSSMPGGNYGTMSGTSMATPHVSGAVLLLRNAFPEAMPEDIKYALYMSAVDLGPAGEENTFGRGRLDMVEAYLLLQTLMVDSDGKIRMGVAFSCDDVIEFTVMDQDLSGPTTTISISSETESAPEIVTLDLTGNPGIYVGSINTTDQGPVSDGLLSLSHGDSLTAVYVDADDGNGNYNVEKEAEAIADCLPPIFAGLSGGTAGDYYAELTWDEASDEREFVYNVYRAEVSGQQDFLIPLDTTTASPYIDNNLENGQEYFYVVRAMDVLGNEDNNTVEVALTPVGPDRIFEDDFDSKSFSQWTVINSGTTQGTWVDDNPEGQWSQYWQGTFAICDRNAYILGRMNGELITPEIDCRGYEDIEVRFSHEFSRSIFEIAQVDYSFDQVNWVTIVTYQFDSAGGYERYLVPALDHKRHVFIRFHYYNAGLPADYWGVDNVEITGWPAAGDDDDDADDYDDDDENSCCG